jgi:multidrug resistance efflux pump
VEKTGGSREGPTSLFDRLTTRLDDLDGSPEQFAANILTLQCLLSQVKGAVLVEKAGQGAQAVALYPPPVQGEGVPSWLEYACGMACDTMTAGTVQVKPLPAQNGSPESRLLLIPLSLDGAGRAVETFVVPAADRSFFERSRQTLETTALLVALGEKRLEHSGNRAVVDRLRKAMGSLSAVNDHDRFRAAAMAFCNEIATQRNCERVGLGFLRGRYVRLVALSHTEHFTRKMKMIQDIEAAMEECLDQDCEVFIPAAADATYISRVTSDLATYHGPASILNLPLRRNSKVEGVLMLQRSPERPFTAEEVESSRLACDLCTPRLVNLREHDRWIGARAATKLRQGAAVLVGAEHTWVKLAAAATFAFIVFLVFAKGQYKAQASFVFEATLQQTLCAPFDGFLKTVNVEIGDAIEQGRTVLGELDTAELKLKLAAAKAEKAGYLKEMAAAMRDNETARAQIAQANADKAQAEVELDQYFIDHARILSPATGVVVTGDLKRQIGAPVKTGDTLFEVTPLESLRAQLHIPEDQIFDVAVGQHGYLATVSYPSRRIEFVVERVDPAAEVVNNRNVFKVRAKLLDTQSWMRPGMEGVAKVNIGKRHYVWIWTRKLVNWIRMKLWI